MEHDKEYFVFISYSSLDNEWAIWLRHELEHYHLPASFNGRTDVRDNLRKVFRDRDELSAGPEWDEQVRPALENTNNLIVICSPNSAKSQAVNKEIETFIALGKDDHIFPFIVEGDRPEDCFPKALKHSKLGGDVNKDGGRDLAFIKVVAGMLKVSYPSLWDRYEIEKAEEERKIREQRDKLLLMQSRFLAEKANTLVDEGYSFMARLLALEALPKDTKNPDRPLVHEAETALRRARNERLFSLDGHADIVECAVFAKNGELIISASRDDTIKIWSIKRRKCIKTIKDHIGTVTSIAVHPQNDFFVTASYEQGISLWDLDSFERIATIEDSSKKGDIDYTRRPISISPDGSILASSSHNIIMLWDLETNKIIKKLKGHSNYVNSLFFNSDGQWLTSCSWDDTVKIWNLKEPQLQESVHFISYDTEVSFAAFLPSKGEIITTSWDNKILIWQVNDKNELVSFQLGEHDTSINSACLNHNERYLVTASLDGIIKLWDIENFVLLGVFKHIPTHGSFKGATGINYMEFHPNESFFVFATNDFSILVWDFTSFFNIIHLGSHWGRTTSISCCEIKNYIATGSDDASIIIWDLQERKDLHWLDNEESVDSLSFSPNGKFLASSSFGNTKINIWSVEKGILICSLDSHHSEGIQSIAFSPNNRELVSVYSDNIFDKTILIWDIETRKVVKIIDELIHVKKAIYSKDGMYIIITTFSNEIVIINTNTWETFTIKGHSDDSESIDSAIINKDNTQIIISSSDGIVDVIDLNSQEIIKTYGKKTGSSCADTSVMLSPDEKWILSKFLKRIKILDKETGLIIFSADLASFTDVIFASNTFLAWRGNGGGVFTWQIPSLQDLIKETRKEVEGYILTPEERKKYYLD